MIERLGFGYDAVREINPRIIYAQIKGFPPGTPYENYLCFDNIAQAMGGIMSVNGFEGQRPVRAGVTIGDTGTGLHCVDRHPRARCSSGIAPASGSACRVSMWEAMTNFLRMSYGGAGGDRRADDAQGQCEHAEGDRPERGLSVQGRRAERLLLHLFHARPRPPMAEAADRHGSRGPEGRSALRLAGPALREPRRRSTPSSRNGRSTSTNGR